MKKLLLSLVAVFSFAGAYAYELGDYIYTATAKYKVIDESQINPITTWTGTDDPDTWSTYEEEGVTDALQSLDGSEGSTLLRTNAELTFGQRYIVTLKIKGVATTVSSVTPGAQNEINAFITNAEPSADGIRTGSENVDYFQVANTQTILNDEWAEITFAFVDTCTENTIGSDTHYLNITIGRLTTNTVVADAEVRPVEEVYDTRKMDRKIAFAQKLLADPNFAEAGSADLEEVIETYQGMVEEGATDDIAEMESLEALLDEAEKSFIESVATDLVANFEKIDITSVTKINNGDGGGSVNQGCWSTSGGASRWGHGSGEEWLNYSYPGSYALPWGCITAKPTGGIVLPPGKYMFMCDLYATQYLNTKVGDGYYGQDLSVWSEGNKLFIGTDTVEIETPIANRVEEAERYYIISEIEQDEEFSAGAWFPGFDPYGGTFRIGHAAVYAFGDIQQAIDRQNAWNTFKAQWDAATNARNSVMNKMNDANYPWEQDSLQRAVNKWDYLYTNILGNWITADGKDAGIATNDELTEWAKTQGYEYKEGEDPEWAAQYPLVRAYQYASNYVQDQNQPFINLKAKVAEAEVAVANPKYASVDPTDLNSAINDSKTLIASVSAVNQHDDFQAQLDDLSGVLEEFYINGASFYEQAELAVINPNFTFKKENLAGGTSATDASGGWNSYTTNTSEYWRLNNSDAGYVGGGAASMWRGWTGNPVGSLTQDLVVTRPGHYNFKCEAYATGDNSRIISSVRHINIYTETQSVWDEELEEWVEEEVEIGRDTTYISGIKLVFGPADATEIDSLDVWTSGETVGNYAPQYFEMEYDKTTEGEETLRFGMDGLGATRYHELGIYSGDYHPNAYGFGSVHVTFCGPSEKYYQDKEEYIETGIEQEVAEAKKPSVPVAYFTLAGTTAKKNQKGFIIIQYADGTSKKVFNKQ